MRNLLSRVSRHLAMLTTLMALSGLAASVQAASFRKSWDPEFSDLFSTTVGVDVGWRGDALIFVDDACVTSSDVVNFPDGCGTSSLLSYELEFYDVNTDALLGTGSDSTPGTPPFPAVTAISFDGSALPDGVSLAGPLFVPGAFSFGSYPATFQAILTFDLSGPSLALRENCDDDICPFYGNDGETYPPTVTWQWVPAPAPLALLGLGLVLMGMVLRRTA